MQILTHFGGTGHSTGLHPNTITAAPIPGTLESSTRLNQVCVCVCVYQVYTYIYIYIYVHIYIYILTSLGSRRVAGVEAGLSLLAHLLPLFLPLLAEGVRVTTRRLLLLRPPPTTTRPPPPVNCSSKPPPPPPPVHWRSFTGAAGSYLYSYSFWLRDYSLTCIQWCCGINKPSH